MKPEHALHLQVVRYLDLAYPGLLWSHFPAGERRDAKTGAKLKAMGLKAGWPDFVFVMPNGIAAFLELKATSGRFTPAQKAFRDQAVSHGAWWAEARSLAEVEDILHRWVNPLGWGPKARFAA